MNILGTRNMSGAGVVRSELVSESARQLSCGRAEVGAQPVEQLHCTGE